VNPQAPDILAGGKPTAEARVAVRDGFAWDAFDTYLFDIDGTLLRSQDRIHVDSFVASIEKITGHALSFDGVVIQGSTDPAIVRDMFRVAKRADTEWKPLLARIFEEMRTSVQAQKSLLRPLVMPGVEAALEHLERKGAVLGVATGNLEAIGWLKLEVSGLRHWFRFGGFSDQYEIRAEMIAHAAQEARKLAGENASVCVIGDTPSDISAAKANSLPVVAVATGRYSFDDLQQFEPDACATTLAALLASPRGDRESA
jgi:phosphoglycolate phosphatase